MAAPTAAASARIFCIRSSGCERLALLDADGRKQAQRFRIHRVDAGSSCTTSLTSSKNEKSIAWMVLNALPVPLMNFVSGGFAACDSG